MKKLFVIGGMGAGKSTAALALAEKGLPLIDLDKVGHEILLYDTVKDEIRAAFGDDVFMSNGEINRRSLAAAAFTSSHGTHKLNNITMPRIEELYLDHLAEIEKTGAEYVVVEYSAFKGKETSLAFSADVIIAVVASLDKRIARAVAAGWDEDDVRARISRQITDANRIDAADVVFNNDGSPEELRAQVNAWWEEYQRQA